MSIFNRWVRALESYLNKGAARKKLKTKQQKCRLCGAELSKANIVAGEFFHFHGFLNECKSCGVLLFPNEILFFNRDRSLTSDSPFGEISQSNSVNANIVYLEDEYVFIWPFSLDSDKVDCIELHIGRDRLNEETALFALDAFRLSMGSFIMKYPFLVNLKFAGYNADAREVYDIDEIQAWMSYLFQEQPDYICFLPAKGLQVALLTLARGLPKDYFHKAGTMHPNYPEETRRIILAATIALSNLKDRFNVLSEPDLNGRFEELKIMFIKRLRATSDYDFNELFKKLST